MAYGVAREDFAQVRQRCRFYFSNCTVWGTPRKKKTSYKKNCVAKPYKIASLPVNLIETSLGYCVARFRKCSPKFFFSFLQRLLLPSCGGGRDLRFIGGAARESDVGTPFVPFAV